MPLVCAHSHVTSLIPLPPRSAGCVELWTPPLTEVPGATGRGRPAELTPSFCWLLEISQERFTFILS